MDIREGRARVGALELAYEDWGDPADPALLLIMVLSAAFKGAVSRLAHRLERYAAG